MRYQPRTRIVFLGVVNGLILLHVVAYYAFGRTQIGCVDFFGLATFAGKGQLTAGSVFVGILILLTLLLGRVFCGWGCHFAFFQDLLVRGFERLGLRIPFRRSRLELVVPPLLFFVTLMVPVLMWWAQHGLPTSATTNLSYPEVWHLLPAVKGVVLMLAVDVVALTLLFGSRAFCRYVCPYGLFLKPFHALSPTRVVKAGNCDDCGACARACPTGVPIKREIDTFGVIHDLTCINCGDCVAACPSRALAIRPTRKAYQHAFTRTIVRLREPYWVDLTLLAGAVLGLFFFRGREFGDFLSVGLGLVAGASCVFAISPRTFLGVRRASVHRWRRHLRFTAMCVACFLVLGLIGQTIGHAASTRGERLAQRGQYAALERTYWLALPAIHLLRPFTFYLDDFSDRQRGVANRWRSQADDLLLAGEWGSAAQLYRAVLLLDPRRVAVYGDLGTALLKQGDFWGAASCYLEVLKSDPNDLVALYHLAIARIQLKQHDDAVALVHQILTIDKVGNAYELIRNNPLFQLLERYPGYRRSMSAYALVHPSSTPRQKGREIP